MRRVLIADFMPPAPATMSHQQLRVYLDRSTHEKISDLQRGIELTSSMLLDCDCDINALRALRALAHLRVESLRREIAADCAPWFEVQS